MKNNQKIRELKVYGILLDYSDANFVSVQCAYSLEEAFVLAKLDYEEQRKFMGGLPVNENARISLFAIRTLAELKEPSDPQKMMDTVKILKKLPSKLAEGLPSAIGSSKKFTVDDFIGAPIEKTQGVPTPKRATKEPTFKNALMKEILDNKNKKLYEKNKEVFTDAEKGYILERLK